MTTENLGCAPESDMRPTFLMASRASGESASGLGPAKICDTSRPSNSAFRAAASRCHIPFAGLTGRRSVFSWLNWFYGNGAYGVELTGGQQDAEIVLGIYVEQLGLDLPILSFGEHVCKLQIRGRVRSNGRARPGAEASD